MKQDWFWFGISLLPLICNGSLLLAEEEAHFTEISVRPVFGADAEFHSIHAYNLTCPESPDGRWLLFFRSTNEDAHHGDVCILSRGSDEIRVLAAGVEVQDAHRVACQQWARDGRTVVYQDLRDGKSVVVAVDVKTLETTVLGRERQIGFGPPAADSVLLYGEHWAPARFGDISIVEIASGETELLVPAESVRPAYAPTGYAEYLDNKFREKQIALFFPNLSPDQQRVYFKLSTPNGLGFRDGVGHGGSDRAGIFVFDRPSREYLFLHPKWGHPTWHPDSKHIVNMWSSGAVLINVETGAVEKKLAQPEYLRSGGHPSVAPGGQLFVTDGVIPTAEPGPRQWGVVVGDFEKQQWSLIHQFDNSHGARSWRSSHPHPVFSHDGRRIYYNVSSDRWSRLYVADFGL